MASKNTARGGTRKKSSTTKRSTSGGRGTGHKKMVQKKRGETISEFWSIPMFGLGLLLLLMAIIKGDGENALRNVLLGIFGLGLFPLAIIVLVLAFLVAIRRPIGKPAWKSALLLLLWCAVPVAFSDIAFADQPVLEIEKTLFQHGQQNLWSGGVIGGLLGAPLVALLGRPMANIVLILACIVMVMVLLAITPADIVDFFSGIVPAVKSTEEIKKGYYPEETWDDRHTSAAERRAQARAEALERRRVQQQEREEARQNQNRRRQANVDIDLGPESTQPVQPTPEREDGVTFLDVLTPPPPIEQTGPLGPLDIGPGGTFGQNPLGHRSSAMPHVPGEDYSVPLNMEQPDTRRTAAPEEDEAVRAARNQAWGWQPSRTAEQEEPATEEAEFEIVPEEQQPAQNAPTQQYVRPQAPPPMRGPITQYTSAPQASSAAAQGKEIENLIVKAVNAPAVAEAAAGRLPTPKEKPAPDYRYPPLNLFAEDKAVDDSRAVQEMKQNADTLVNTLESFGVKTKILDICRGPSVTRYELQPMAGVKVSRITGLADDIALNLAAVGVRIEAPIPGKPAVGIEVPNRVKTPVGIRSLLESQNYTKSASPLTMVLGRDIAGAVQVADLCKMPHLLIAGSTGSGKSVCVNSILISFLYKSSPEDVKLILIDPKVVELSEYNGIPHLLMPVVTDAKKASGALGSAVAEMERRYKMFADTGVREIKSYNRKAATTPGMEKMPYIAIVIDELADLMMVSGKEVEDYICRIAQKARAAGMHLIVATQRPSVDVVTGLIKANIPSRIAFAVSSQVDSRTILDGSGAEKLLGAGDMLFMPIGANKPVRVQGAFVRDEEIESVLNFIKQGTEAQYDEAMMAEVERLAAEKENSSKGGSGDYDDEDSGHDPMFEQAVEAVIDAGQASTSLLQRRCKLGYARAARIMDEMEQAGVIGPFEGAKPRKVLYTRQQWQERKLMADNTVLDDIPF